MLPNLLPQQHGVVSAASAASAYIPGTELPDAVPSPTPDQVSHLPPPAPLAAACSACPAPGGGIRSRAAPLRSRSLRYDVAAIQGYFALPCHGVSQKGFSAGMGCRPAHVVLLQRCR